MKNSDNKKNKIFILIVSILLVGTCVIAYFLDNSLDWGVEKIISCIFVNIWLFFMIPAFRYVYLAIKDKSYEESFRIGMIYIASGLILPILFSPYYGIRYYLK